MLEGVLPAGAGKRYDLDGRTLDCREAVFRHFGPVGEEVPEALRIRKQVAGNEVIRDGMKAVG